MKLRALAISTAILSLGTAALPSAASAELSANVGWVSDYIFRGIPQNDSSAQAGLDFSQNGFYAGTWGADVGQGSEIDLYFGYEGEVSDWTYGIGATGYFYTDDFDDTYRELNLSLGYDFFSLAAAFGEYDNFAGPTVDYRFLSAAFDIGPVTFTFGTFGDDADGEYIELNYGWAFEGLDLSFGVVHSTDDLLGTPGTDDTSLVFGISKTFELSD